MFKGLGARFIIWVQFDDKLPKNTPLIWGSSENNSHPHWSDEGISIHDMAEI
jgi:hypothetical protein